MFHNTTPDLQEQDRDRFFFDFRPTVSDHITDYYYVNAHSYSEKFTSVLIRIVRCNV